MRPWSRMGAPGVAAVVGGCLAALVGVMEWRSGPDADRGVAAGCLLGGAVGVGVGCWLLASAATDELARRVAALAPVAGRTVAEFRRRLGEPARVETTDAGDTLLTWRAPFLRVTVAFRDGAATRVAGAEDAA